MLMANKLHPHPTVGLIKSGMTDDSLDQGSHMIVL